MTPKNETMSAVCRSFRIAATTLRSSLQGACLLQRHSDRPFATFEK